VLEVNSSPGLEGIEKATGKDIASKIVEYAEKLIEHKNNKISTRRKIKPNA